MTKEPLNTLEQMANELVDSLTVDWEKADALREDEQRLLKHFNTISQVAQIHLSQQHKPDELATRSRQAKDKQALFFWGRLSVLEKIGEGAFGEVYRAHDDVLDRDVALKLLKKEISTPHKSQVFIEEAKRLAKVRHPNVLAIHGANIHEGRAGFWADLIKGHTLKELHTTAPLGYSILFEITRQITQGLDAINHAGIIHGDIKPANIMQDERDDFLIMDFGAGMALDELESLAGFIHGTPSLMAPEIFMEKHAGLATDIYALGATLFKLATSQYAVQGDDLIEIEQAHKKQRYLSLKKIRPDLPKEYINLVQLMLTVEPADRPDTQTILKKLYDIETAPQRRKNMFVMGSIIGLLIIGTTLSTLGFYQANQAKTTALLEKNKAQTVNSFLQDMLKASSELGGGRDVRVADVLDQASDKLLSKPPDDNNVALEMHQSLASSYNALSNPEKGKFHAQKSLQLAEIMYSDDDENLIRSQLELISALENNLEHKASIALAKKVITEAESTLGADHWYIQQARKFIITNLFALSEFDEAIAILDEHFQQVPDPKTATNNFGFEILQAKNNALHVKGRFGEAIAAAKEAIAWLEAYPNKSLLNMESVQTALGLAQLESGLIDEGVETLEKVLALNEKIYGNDNQEYIDALVNLGAAQRVQNKPELAKQTTMQAYELAKKIYGDNKNLITVAIGTNLANMLVDLGDVTQGEEVMRESLEMAHQVLGPDKPQSLILEYNLAELLNNLGRYHEALEYAISTHRKKIDALGENHPYVFLSLDNWAISLRGLGQIELALQKHQEAVDDMAAAMGAKHAYTLLVRQHQMDTLLIAEQGPKTDSSLAQLVEDLHEVLGIADPVTQHYQQLLESR
ncbi:protein kinase [Marinicella sp. W31]|uniref:protein kinase domain-containing protein n=1 Tax=Marinicella sp. W31 TaxID=3023713 RepID=UPI003756ED28